MTGHRPHFPIAARHFLFCDGVLVDLEPIACPGQALQMMVEARHPDHRGGGCGPCFSGTRSASIVRGIEQRAPKPPPRRLGRDHGGQAVGQFRRNLEPVSGHPEAGRAECSLAGIAALRRVTGRAGEDAGIPRVDRLSAAISTAGSSRRMRGREGPKPFPDLFSLRVRAARGRAGRGRSGRGQLPSRVTAAVAAGMRALGYSASRRASKLADARSRGLRRPARPAAFARTRSGVASNWRPGRLRAGVGPCCSGAAWSGFCSRWSRRSCPQLPTPSLRLTKTTRAVESRPRQASSHVEPKEDRRQATGPHPSREQSEDREKPPEPGEGRRSPEAAEPPFSRSRRLGSPKRARPTPTRTSRTRTPAASSIGGGDPVPTRGTRPGRRPCADSPDRFVARRRRATPTLPARPSVPLPGVRS